MSRTSLLWIPVLAILVIGVAPLFLGPSSSEGAADSRAEATPEPPAGDAAPSPSLTGSAAAAPDADGAPADTREEIAADAAAELGDGGGNAPAEVVVPVTGTLQLADGTPLEGYRVQLVEVDETNRSAGWTETGPNGAFRFEGAREAGRYRVRLWAKYGAPSRHEPPELIAPFDDVAVEVDAILVRAHWAEGMERPEPGAAVEVSFRPFGEEDPPTGAVTELETASEAGSIERLLPIGCGYVVSARSGLGAPGAFVVPEGRSGGLFIGELAAVNADLGAVRLTIGGELPAGTRLNVRLDAVEDSFPFPVPLHGVIALIREGQSEQRVSGLLPGRYAVTVSMGGRPPFGYVLPVLEAAEVAIQAGEITACPIQLVPAGLLEVTVDSGDGASDVFAVEFLDPADSTWRHLIVSEPSGGPPRATIPTGKPHVTVNTLPAGLLRVRASGPGRASPEVEVEIRADETARARLVVES